jgi:tetratricopeptide (TPR) repeat protein
MCLHGSRHCPLILELEDLHWIDTSSEECLTVLVERMAGAALLVLVTYRPGYRPAWVAKSYATQVALPPLSPQASLRVVQAVLPAAGQAAPLVPQLLTKAEGNPFFLEELARTMAEQGAAASLSAVPDTVQAVLTARMDRLPATAKRLLQAAAVIGKDVALPLLQTVTAVSEEAIHYDLRHLQAAEFLYETYARTALAYTFTHVLTQEVAYQSLVRRARQQYHIRIAQVLEAQFPEVAETQPALLAHHYTEAGCQEHAVGYWQRAGQQAAQRGTYQEAVGFYEQALGALQQLPTTPDRLAQTIDLHLALDEALFPLGAYHRSCDVLRAAERLATGLGDQRQLGWVTEALATAFRRIGAYDQAVALAQRAMALAMALGDVALQVWSALRLGQTYYCLGDYQRASDCFREVIASPLENSKVSEAVLLPAHGRSWLVYCLAACGEFSVGLALGAEAVRLAEAGDFPTSRCAAYASLGYLSLVKGAFRPAIAFLEQGLDLCRRWHNLDWLPECVASLGLAYALAGHLDDALPLLEQAVEQEAMMGGGLGALRITDLSQGYLLAGRLEEARTHAARALVLARERQDRGIQAYALWLLGEIAARGDLPEGEPAETCYQQGLALVDELGMRPLQAHCHLGLGMLYAKTGQREQARTALATAIDLYRAMEMTFWLPQAEAALAQVEGQ